MKIIVWLGNPWEQYKNTRHNIGFMFLDFFKNKLSFWDFYAEKKFNGLISTWIYNWEKTILLKPQTYMNLSGESLKKIYNFYKITLDDVIVIYDDLSLNFGKIRFRNTGSAGWHNGVKDIIKHFSIDFKRIKVGIGYNDNYEVSDWVLSKFTQSEIDEFENIYYEKILELLDKHI